MPPPEGMSALGGGSAPGGYLLIGGGLLPGVCLLRAGVCLEGLVERTPGRLLLRAVRILLECILVYILGVEYVIAESHPLELRFESLLCLDVDRLSKIPPVSRLVIAGIISIQ